MFNQGPWYISSKIFAEDNNPVVPTKIMSLIFMWAIRYCHGEIILKYSFYFKLRCLSTRQVSCLVVNSWKILSQGTIRVLICLRDASPYIWLITLSIKKENHHTFHCHVPLICHHCTSRCVEGSNPQGWCPSKHSPLFPLSISCVEIIGTHSQKDEQQYCHHLQ